MEKRKRKLLTGVAAVSAGAAAMGTGICLMAKKLIDIAMDRDGVKPSPNSEKVRNKLCGFSNEDGFIDKLEEGAAKLAAVDTELIETVSNDGTKLTGHLYTCDDPKRLIIAVHG